jgi:threonyl-tRNA synthetase
MTTNNLPELVPAAKPARKSGGGFAKSPPKKNPELQKIRHSYAHVMAMAVKVLFPDAKATIGPDTATGFYYDFDRAIPFTPDDLVKITAEMHRIIAVNLPFVRQELPRDSMRSEILNLDEPYKLELLDSIPEGELISRYFIGDRNDSDAPFWDLCRGPHIDRTGDLHPDAFELTSIAGAYWRGDEKLPMLQRIYGIAFETAEELAAYKHQQEEAKRRDHRILGKQMRLFSIQDEAGGGLVFWHPHGARMRHIIQNLWIDLHLQNGYDLVSTPHMANLDLWKTSGHNDFYRESMFQPMETDACARLYPR